MNKYGKDQCRHMDWTNAKMISNKDLAYCIHTHKLNIDMVPDARLRAVIKELEKLQNQDNKDKERKLIESELSVYKCIGTTTAFFGGHEVEVANYSDEVTGYYLDPDLFNTLHEAVMAKEEFYTCWNDELVEGEIATGKHKNTDTYSRDVTRIQKSMEKVRQQYIALGGLRTEFDKHISQIPRPNKHTLKQSVDSNRERITKDFISVGVSPARAKAISEAITKKSYQVLQ